MALFVQTCRSVRWRLGSLARRCRSARFTDPRWLAVMLWSLVALAHRGMAEPLTLAGNPEPRATHEGLFAGTSPMVTGDWPGLDVVVLIDQTASMGPHPGKIASDPGGLRFDLTTTMTSQLIDSAVSQRLHHRLVVLSFGREIRRELGWSELGATKLELIERIVRSIASRDTGGTTDFVAAIAAAGEALDLLAAESNRRRVVLLLTDGAPYPRSRWSIGEREILRAAIDREVLGHDARLDLLLISERDRIGVDHVDLFWRRLGAHGVWRASSRKEPPSVTVCRVLADLLGTPLLRDHALVRQGSIGREVILPPYLEQVVFDVFGTDPERPVSVDSPDGPVACSVEKATSCVERRVARSLRTLTVRRPAPGGWFLRSHQPSATMEVFARTFYPRGQLLTPQGAIEPTDPLPIAYQLRDAAGSTLDELPAFPLRLDLALVAPDGSKKVSVLVRDREARSGVYRTQSVGKVAEPGLYRVQVVVRAEDSSGKLASVFEDRWATFKVLAMPPRVTCQISSSLSAEPRVVSEGANLEFANPFYLRCVDARGELADLEAMAGVPTTDLFTGAWVRGDLSVPVPLRQRRLGLGQLQVGVSELAPPGTERFVLKVAVPEPLSKVEITIDPSWLVLAKTHLWTRLLPVAQLTVLIALLGLLAWLLLRR